MPAEKHSRTGEKIAVSTFILMALFSACYGLHLWVPNQITQQILNDLEAKLAPIGVNRITAQHHQLTAQYILLHDLEIQWHVPGHSLRVSKILIHLQPKWSSIADWVSRVELSEPHLRVPSKSTRSLNDLTRWHQRLELLSALPWPIDITKGKLSYLDRAPSIFGPRDHSPLAAPNTPITESPSHGFSLSTQPADENMQLLLWRDNPAAQLLRLTRLPNSATKFKQNLPLQKLSWQHAPYALRWQDTLSNLDLRLWPPAPTPGATAQGTHLKNTDAWRVLGRGTLTLTDLNWLQSKDKPTQTTALKLNKAHITLSRFRFALPATAEPYHQTDWLNLITGKAQLNIEALNAPIKTNSVYGDIHITGALSLNIQPGNWELHLTSPTEFDANLMVNAKAAKKESAKKDTTLSKNQASFKGDGINETTPTATHTGTANQLLMHLLPANTPLRIVGNFPARTRFTFANEQYFDLQAEDLFDFALNTSGYNLRGTISQLAATKGDSSQISGLLQMNWKAPPAPPVDLLTQVDIQISPHLVQLDLNGSAPSAGLQWDLHSSIDAAQLSASLNRTLVINPFAAKPRVHLDEFGHISQALKSMARLYRQSRRIVPPFGHLALETQATLDLAAPRSAGIQSSSERLLEYSKNAQRLKTLGLTPLALLIEPSLLLNPPSQEGLRASQIRGKLEKVELQWLLDSYGVEFCRAKGVGTLQFLQTPRSTAEPTNQIRFRQETPGFLTCERASNLATQLQDLSPNISNQYFLPFQSLILSHKTRPSKPNQPVTLDLEQERHTRKLFIPK